MSAAIGIDLAELEEVGRRLARFDAGRRAAFARMLDDIGQEIAERERDRISDDKFDPDGEPWAPWSQSYEESGRGLSLLENTGRLRKSFRVKSSTRTMTVENRAPYAKYHQRGTRRMPARPFMGWGPEELEIANRAATAALQEAFAA